MENKKSRATVTIDEEEWNKFLENTRIVNSDGSKVLRAFIKKFNQDPKKLYLKII